MTKALNDYAAIQSGIMTTVHALRDGGAIEFKTDNDDLFDFSLGEFEAMGFTLNDVTRDLHNSEWNEENIRTEFEQKFADQGITIKRVVANL